MLLPRVGDEQTQRALDAIKVTAAQVQQTVAAAQDSTTTLQAQVDAISTAGRLLAVRKLTGSGTYTPTAGATCARLLIQGAGSGAGGAQGGAGQAAGAGGGAGVLLDVFAGTPGTPLTGGSYSCGAAGSGGSNAGGNGNTGGDTTIAIGGTTYTAKGAVGGGGMASSTLAGASGGIGQSGSTSGGAVLSETTARGEMSLVVGGGAFAGNGASSRFGTGGSAASGFAAGSNATGFGAGGGGGKAAGAGFVGGDATPGAIIIEEYS